MRLIVVLPDTTYAMYCGLWHYMVLLMHYLILLMPWIVVLSDTTYAMDCGII